LVNEVAPQIIAPDSTAPVPPTVGATGIPVADH
jgi:hypothetical protein